MHGLMPDRELDVVLYGATGYTGRLIAQELAEQEAEFAIAGRSPGKLDDLADELDAEPTVIEASIDDAEALESMASRAPVVASAAGPFEDLGPPVIEACLSEGTDFLDITGEQTFLRWAANQDARVERAGQTVVNAMGFDVVPSDMAAVLASEGMDQVEELELFIASNSKRSSGTLRTMARAAGKGWRYEDGEFKRTPPGRFAKTVEFPVDPGEVECLFIPWGDVATAPRSTGARNVRTFFMGSEDTVERMNRFWPVTMAASYVPFLGTLLEKRAPEPGYGPDAERREETWFTIMGVARDRDGNEQTSVVTGGDPYDLTAAAAARGSLAMARGEVDETGVLTPTQAFGAQRLEKMLPDEIDDASVL